MSGRKEKRYRVKISFPDQAFIQYTYAKSEEEAIEEICGVFLDEIVHHHLKYTAEEVEEEEE